MADLIDIFFPRKVILNVAIFTYIFSLLHKTEPTSIA